MSMIQAAQDADYRERRRALSVLRERWDKVKGLLIGDFDGVFVAQRVKRYPVGGGEWRDATAAGLDAKLVAIFGEPEEATA